MKQLDFNAFDVLYSYGKIPLKEIYNWLSQKKERAYVLIDPEEIPFTDHPQVFVISGKEEEIKTLCWKFVFLRSHFHLAESLAKEQKHKGEEIGSMLANMQNGVHLAASEYSDFGAANWKNAKAHLLSHPRLVEEGWENCFKGIPAIICGGGPSLSENLPLLQTLSDRALLLAGGSSLTAVTPHLAADLDPKIPFDRFFSQNHFEVPFFLQTRVSTEILKCAHSSRFFFRGQQNASLEDWLSGLPKSGREWGWNVVTFLAHIALLSGCDPIVFVGVDLAAVGRKLYADEAASSREGCITFKNGSNERMITKRDWLMSAQWLSELIEGNRDRRWINTSRKGIPIGGCETCSLSEISFPHPYDLKGWVHGACQTFPFHELKVEMAPFDQSLQDCKKLCQELLHHLENLFSCRKIPPAYLATHAGLESEPLFAHLLEPNWKIWKPVFARHSDLEDPYNLQVQKILFYQSVLEAYV